VVPALQQERLSDDRQGAAIVDPLDDGVEATCGYRSSGDIIQEIGGGKIGGR
jgi:hypothetical protein